MANSSSNIRVVIADDHEIFRDGFRLTLSRNNDITLVAEAADGLELVQLVETHQPDVVITDIKMPRMDGIAAAKEISQRFPDIGIIGLSMFDEEDLILEMMDSGANGYLMKNADKEEVVDAIKSVFNHQTYYCRHTSRKLAQILATSRHHAQSKSAPIVFTEKELEIIQLICQELTNKEIGDRLFLSVRTVEGYRLKILEKMQVKNSVGLVVYAIQNGIFEPGK